VNKTNSVIEINGNKYDAVTGQLLHASRRIRQTTSSSSKKMIDGFVMGAHHTKTKIKRTGAQMAKAQAKGSPHARGLHTAPEKPRTLVRKAVKRPGSLSKPAESLAARYRAARVNPTKELRAKTVDKHTKVSRFGHFPKQQKIITTSGIKPVKRAVEAEVVTNAARMPSMVTSVSHRKLEQMLDEALVNANAHKFMTNSHGQGGFISRAKILPKWLSFSLVGFILAVILAFLVWQNLPAVAVHVAAAKAHINASMPAYTPSGYSFVGPLNYSQGQVTMQFKPADGGQGFSLTQKASNWNSESLQENALPKEGNVKTSEVNGTTVFIYGDHNDAVWVNHSVLYSLKNQADLTSDQVLRIVQGL
jgi:hypothetical protein